MARVTGSSQKTVITEQRSWRVEVFSDLGRDPLIKFHRERIMRDGETNEVIGTSEVLPMREKPASKAIADGDEATLASGKKITFAEIAEAVALMGDLWEEQAENPPVAPDAETPQTEPSTESTPGE